MSRISSPHPQQAGQIFSAPQRVVINNLPKSLSNVDVGTIIKGEVLGKANTVGHIRIQTQNGVVELLSKLNLPKGSQVQLQVQSVGSQLQAVLLSVEKPTTPNINTNTHPANTTPKQPLPSVTGNIPTQSKPTPQTPSIHQSLPPVEAGRTITATVVRSLQSTPVNQPIPQTATLVPTPTQTPTTTPPSQPQQTPQPISSNLVAAQQQQPTSQTPLTPQTTLIPTHKSPSPASVQAYNTHPTQPQSIDAKVQQILPTNSSVLPTIKGESQHPASKTIIGQVVSIRPSSPAIPSSTPQILIQTSNTQTTLPNTLISIPTSSQNLTPNLQVGSTIILQQTNINPIQNQNPTLPQHTSIPTQAHHLPQTSTPASTQPTTQASQATVQAQPYLPHNANLIPLKTSPLQLTQKWENLSQLLLAIQQPTETSRPKGEANHIKTTQTALPLPQLQNLVPQANNQLESTILLFLHALKKGQINEWLGKETIHNISKAGHPEFTKELAENFQTLSRLSQLQNAPQTQQAQQTQNQQPQTDWRHIFIPFYDENTLQQIRFFYRNANTHEDHKEDDSTRFIVEIDMSNLGPLQLDGLIKQKRFDIILRSHIELPEDIQTEVFNIYQSSIEAAGFKGSFIFKTLKNFPIDPTGDLVHTFAPDLAV